MKLLSALSALARAALADEEAKQEQQRRKELEERSLRGAMRDLRILADRWNERKLNGNPLISCDEAVDEIIEIVARHE